MIKSEQSQNTPVLALVGFRTPCTAPTLWVCCHSVQFTVMRTVMPEISNTKHSWFYLVHYRVCLAKKNVHFYAVFIQAIFTMAVTWSTEHNSLGSFLLNFPWSFLYWNGYLFMDRRVTHAFVFLSSQHNYFFFVQARFCRCVCGLHLQ